MNQRNSKPAINPINHSYGLSLNGTVIDRTRRMVPRNNPTTEIVTYTIQDDNNRKYYVDDYSPDGYLELDSPACFPVYIKPFLRKNGEVSYTINVLKNQISLGEHFLLSTYPYLGYECVSQYEIFLFRQDVFIALFLPSQ